MLPEERSKMNAGPSDLPPELQSLEAALAALAPRAERLDRDRLMFEAGRESVLRATAHRRWIWPALSTATTAMAATLLVILVLRPEPRVAERVANVPTAPPAEKLAHESPRLRAGEGSGEAPGARTASGNQSSPLAPRGKMASAAEGHSIEKPYLDLRDGILRDGVDAWPTPALSMNTPAAGPTAPPTYTELRDELLNRSSSQAWIQ